MFFGATACRRSDRSLTRDDPATRRNAFPSFRPGKALKLHLQNTSCSSLAKTLSGENVRLARSSPSGHGQALTRTETGQPRAQTEMQNLAQQEPEKAIQELSSLRLSGAPKGRAAGGVVLVGVLSALAAAMPRRKQLMMRGLRELNG